MRRSDREVTDHQEIFDILNKCNVIRFGINAPDFPYVVQMNFRSETAGKSLTLWFHCASKGFKLDLIKENPRVGFEADCSHNLVSGEKVCYYTMEYESVIGCGNIEICDDNDSKRRSLNAIMHRYAPKENFEFSDSELSGVYVLRQHIKQPKF